MYNLAPNSQLTSFILTVALLLSYSVTVVGQKPSITSVINNKGSMGQIISIKGNNFGTNVADLTVFFGASKGNVITATNQLIEVEVPAGATFQNISVTRSQTIAPPLTAYFRQPFLLSFGGSNPFNVANLETQFNKPALKGLYDLCLCDFNGDNKPDIATANNEVTNISILTNTSSPGTLSFSSASLLIGGKTLHVSCGDLNGDGKPDIVATSGDGGNKIYILQNNGTGFTLQTISLTITETQKIKIADVDQDGKPDLIITHKNGPGQITILQNITTTGSIAYSSPISILVNGVVSTDGLEVADLNGDFLPEIITSSALNPSSPLCVLKNESTPGTISFAESLLFDCGGVVVNIKAGDLNGDGKNDVAVTQLFDNKISVFLNQSSEATINLINQNTVTPALRPWGLDFGDVDGDGKADIVVASVDPDIHNLTIFNNTSMLGSLSFIPSLKATDITTKHLNIGDVDGDGKPDIAFTSIDDSPTPTAQQISVFRNATCMVPQIIADGSLNVCTGTSLKLLSTISGGASYQWRNITMGTNVGINNPVFTVPTGVVSTNKYSVIVTPQAGGIACTAASNELIVKVTNGSAAVPIFTSSTDPICIGNSLTLSVVDAGYQYKWSGPEGYSVSGNPAIRSNFQPEFAGKYFVDVIDNTGNCVAQRASIIVEAIDAQNFELTFSGSDIFCEGDTKILQVSPSSPTYSYKYFKDGALLSTSTLNTLNVTTSGEYHAQVITSSCGTPETTTATLTVATIPVVDFSFSPNPACAGQNIVFETDVTNVTSGLPVFYKWNFGDGQISSEQSPTHKYVSATPAVKNLKLTVSYSNTTNVCDNFQTSTITIEPAPLLEIISEGNPTFKFCAGDKLVLKTSNSFDAYEWSNDEENPTIEVTESGTYTVEVKSGSCTLKSERKVEASSPHIKITAEPAQIAEGQNSQLIATGLVDYTWSPTQFLSNPLIANPVASPLVTTTYLVTGKDADGCSGTSSFVLEVKGEPIVNKLKASNMISPNGKDGNDFWSIDKILDYPQCNVAIYDDKGIKIFEAKPYTNDWDGIFKGKSLPDGVYYYVIRCDGEESKPKSGSITLLR